MLFKAVDFHWGNKLDAGHSHPSWWHRMDLWDPNVEGFPQLILFRPSWNQETPQKKIPQKTRWKLLRRREGHPLHKASLWEADDDIPSQIRYESLLTSHPFYSSQKIMFHLISTTWLLLPAKSTAEVSFPPPRKQLALCQCFSVEESLL